ncbi:MAG: hypothetical protein V6Z86_05950 [Hyphomicrobiales bacterium]
MTTIPDAVSRPPKTPDLEHIAQSPSGETYYRFSVTYDHEGTECCVDVWAMSFADAQRRLESLKRTARLDGQIYRTIPARDADKAIN